MKKRTLRLLAALMACCMLCACSSKEEAPAETTPSPAQSTEATVQPTGTIVYGITNSWGSLNPYHVVNYSGFTVHDKLWESLYSVDESGNLINRSCESYEVEEEGKVFVIHLRQDIKWSDGEPVTAQDWEFAARMVADPAVTGMAGKTYPACLIGVDANGNRDESEDFGLIAVDDYTLKFILDDPYNYGQFWLNNYRFYHPLPQHVMKDIAPADFATSTFWLEPVTCGPWKFVSTTPGEEVVMVANENFYYTVKTQNLIIRKVAASSLASSLISGDVNVTSQVQLEDLGALRADGNVTVYKADQTEYVYCHINNAICNKQVRKAINLAIDKQQICDTVFNGEAIPAACSLNPNSPFFGVELSTERDVEAAKKLITESGWDTKTVIKMATPADYREKIALIMQQNLAEIGVKLELTSCDQTAMQAGLKDGTYKMGMQAWGMHYQAPTYFQICQRPGSSINLSFIDYNDYINYTKAIDSCQDEKELYNLVQEYITYMGEDVGHIALCHKNMYSGWSAKVTNGPTALAHDLSWDWAISE